MMLHIQLTSGLVLLLVCAAFLVYELVTFRRGMVQQLKTIGQIVATNSTAALAFDSKRDAEEILAALVAERHITAACVYDQTGQLFAHYPPSSVSATFPAKPGELTHRFRAHYLEIFLPIQQGNVQLGTLFLQSDTGAMRERLMLYGAISFSVILLSMVLAYLLSNRFQKTISTPISSLTRTAQMVSEHSDYSVRSTATARTGELTTLIATFNQMLDRIQAQNQELNRSKEEIRLFSLQLEQKVKERTAELEYANRELESFSYSVSHDLRAPLRSMHGYMNIFAEDYLATMDEEGKRLIGIILTNTKRMGQLIDDLLEFSKLGRKELMKTEINMTEMVSAIWSEQVKGEAVRSINVKIDNLPPAKADNATIKQVWINLISNALKYSRNQPDTEISIGFSRENDCTTYFVKDNGAGFDMLYYDKLFGVFQRLHSYNEFEGTGVGLAIVHRIVVKHGGKIWAEAKPGQGATFFFSLPL